MSEPASPPAASPAWDADRLRDDPHAAADKATRVEAMFAAIAKSYDLNNRLHSFGRDQAWRKAAVKAAGLQGGEAVADVACGTGDLAMAFADAGAAEVIGLDFTQAMLDLAETKRGDRRIAYRHADAMALPLDDASVDVVSIAFGIRNVADPRKALQEFHRVLKPGGRLVVLEFSEPRNPLVRGLDRFYRHRVMPWTATLIARDRSGAYRYLPKSVETFLDRAALSKAISDAGFADVTQRPLTFGVATIHRGVKASRST